MNKAKAIRPLHKTSAGSIIGTEIMDEKQIKAILTNPNDEQKQAIEFAKSFFKENQTLVEEQTKDVIALYSIKNKKPFFFITPAEARIAIDYVKQERTVNTKIQKQRENERKEQEEYLFTPVKLLKENKALTLSNAPSITIKDYSFHIKEQPDIISTDMLSVAALNQLFAVSECKDQNVLALIVNSNVFAEIRLWGQTLYDPATQKEILLYNMWGTIWGATIFIDNNLEKEFWIMSKDIEDNKPTDFYLYQGIIQ